MTLGFTRRRVAACAALATMLAALIMAGRAEAEVCPPEGAHELCSGITYRTIQTPFGPRDFKMDAYLPASAGRHPGVVVVHGGGFLCESENMRSVAQHLADNGFAAFVIHYIPRDNPPTPPGPCDSASVPPDPPANPPYPFPGQFAPFYPTEPNNVYFAVEYVRENAGTWNVEPTRLGLLGSSAGANLAAFVGLYGQGSQDTGARVRAIVGLGTPSTLFDNLTGVPLEAALRRTIANYLGAPCTPANIGIGGLCAPYAAVASPISYVDPTDPPMLMIHGQQDPIVPFAQATSLRDTLLSNGVAATVEPGNPAECHATQCYAAITVPALNVWLGFSQPKFASTLSFLQAKLLPLP